LQQPNDFHLGIFFLDALRYSDIDKNNTPFLEQTMRDGIGGPLETLLAYEGIAATIFTGTYPTQHGIWTRYYRNLKNSPFKWVHPVSPLLEKVDGPLTSTRAKLVRYAVMRLSTLLAGVSYFPGLDEVPMRELSQLDFSIRKKLFEPHCFGSIPSLFDILLANRLSYRYVDHDLFDTDDTVCQKVLGQNFTENVTLVRLVDLDTTSHRYGLGSFERNKIVRHTDALVEKIVTSWRAKHPNLAVACFADHGMVKAEKFVDIQTILRSSDLVAFRDYDEFLDSTVARFWGQDAVIEKIKEKLSGRTEGRVLSNQERAAYHIPASSRWGQLIFLANPGYVISPNFFEKNSQVKAMHGYDPATPGLETFLIANGPMISPQASKTNKLRMVDVFPTILDMLDLPIPQYCPGQSLLGNAHS
jgi:predicted AlkP superfamily pyrophosphatase or phosphodiesterase